MSQRDTPSQHISQPHRTLQSQMDSQFNQPNVIHQDSYNSVHSYRTNPIGVGQMSRAASRPSTAKQNFGTKNSNLLNQSEKSQEKSVPHLPDINLSSQRMRPQSAAKLSQQSLHQHSDRSRHFKGKNIDEAVTAAAITIKHMNSSNDLPLNSLNSQKGDKNSQLSLRQRQDSVQKSLTHRSEDIRDYDRKSAKKQDRSYHNQQNDDIRSQIHTDRDVEQKVEMVDGPLPVKIAFMNSTDSLVKVGLSNNVKNEMADSFMPDQESSQIMKKGFNEKNQKSSDLTIQSPSLNQHRNTQRQTTRQASIGSTTNIIVKTQTTKKRRNHQNQFKEKNLSDKEVIDFLTEFCSTRVNFSNMALPNDFDSTDNLDSFLMALLSVNQESLIQIDNDGLENIHLATGTRTSYCRSLVMAIVEFQNKEVVFSDAIEFFQDSMNKMIQISAENQLRREQIEGLESAKQDLTIKMFDYQKKLTDTSTALLKLRQTEFEQAKILAAVKKQLDHKKAECESLTYMIKNNIKNTGPAQDIDLNELYVPTKGTDYIMSPTTQHQDVQLPEDLPVLNLNVQVLHQQIQKLSIENRQNLDRINEMQIGFDNKDRLIAHLEHNISEMLVEREKNVIRLKSEIVILQNKIHEGEESFKNRLIQMRSRVEVDEKAKVKKTLDTLTEQLESSKRHSADQLQKIKRLQEDYATLGQEFQNYRKEKVLQENSRETYLKDIESKYKTLSEQYSEAQRSMISKLDAVTSQSLQKQNENEVLYLRLKYLRQITDTLQRQKVFLMETLDKSRLELTHAMQVLEEAMINQNKSKSYLISVEKSIKQTRDMSELGMAALHNIENIVKFLKVEKMHELVFDVEPPTPWQEPEHQQERKQLEIATISSKQSAGIKLELQQNTPMLKKSEVLSSMKQSQKGLIKDQSKLAQVQGMLDSLRNPNDIPVQFRPKYENQTQMDVTKIQTNNKTKQAQQVIKNEEYYLEHCPVELCSILLKFVIQELVKVEVVQSVEQIPFSISRLVYLANGKSDLAVEKELFDCYLLESKKILDNEQAHLAEQIVTLNKFKEMVPSKARNKNLILTEDDSKPVSQAQTQVLKDYTVGDDQIEVKQEQQQLSEPKTSPEKMSQNSKYNILSMKAFENPTSKFEAPKQRTPVVNSVLNNVHFEELLNENTKLKNEIQQLQILMTELKHRQKDVQIGLAGEIVELQEHIESLIIKNQEQLVASEVLFRQEADLIKNGCQQREAQLLQQIGKLQERNFELESNNITMTQNQAATKDNKSYVEKAKQILDESKNYQTHSEHLKSKKSMQSLIQTIEEENAHKYQELALKFENYQENVHTYVEIRESNRNTISLVFDPTESNQQMINESILKLYLSKIYRIPVEKFRLLSTQNFVKELANQPQNKVKRQPDEIVMTKVLIEIVEEREMLESKSASLRADINDGSSLLFDLMPSYVCFNLGQGGLASKHKLNQCRLLQKQGVAIDGVEYIVTLLRHKQDLFVFIVIAINMATGEEFVLEMQQKDILTLIEGDLSLFEQTPDASQVQQLILNNLVLLHNDLENEKSLSCEHKVYFNTVMQNLLTSKASTALAQQFKSPNEVNVLRKYEIGVGENQIKHSTYAMSSVRDANLLKQLDKVQSHSTQKNIRIEKDVQTDFASSVLYEAFRMIFTGVQKVSDAIEVHITIQHSAESNTMKLQFQDIRTQKLIQFFILQNNQSQTLLNQDSDEEEQDKAFMTQTQEQYFLLTQCLIIDESQIVLISVEKLQNQGLLIKIHDLKLQTSTEIGFFLKSNGQMSRLPIGASVSQLPNEHFRQMVFDLTFNQVAVEDQQHNQTIARSYLTAEDKLLQESKDPMLAEQQLFSDITNKRRHTLNKLSSKAIVLDALKLEGNPYARHSTSIESFKQLQERGLLLFRDSLHVRVSESLAAIDDTEGTTAENQQQQPIIIGECRAVMALVSLHIKDRIVNIEVFLHKNGKISVTSVVDVDQLFLGEDPRDMSPQERQKVIRQLLEKLFVLTVQGRCEMKIEQEAQNITDVLEAYEQNGGMPGQEDSHAATVARNKALVQRNYEDKTREFQIEKGGYVQSGRAVMFSEYVSIGEVGQVFELRIYILLKKDKKQGKPSQKRLNTFGKTQLQIETQKLEQHIDDFCDFETIYLETADPKTKDPINILIDKKRLVQILVKDITVDWAQLVINWRQKLVPYIKHCIQIDTQNAKISLRNTTDISKLIISHCQSIHGSKIADREEQAVIETFKDECAELLDKTLVLNQEVDFAEFSYDIKLFSISKKINAVEDCGVQTFGYHVEVFNINEPDKIYKYRLPIACERSNDPITFTADVFNLINHEAQQIEMSTEADKVQKVGAQSRHKQLVKRYVDNNLVLMVQQNKFPAIINLMLVEASSGLSWNQSYEPNTEITSAASFCLLEMGSLEQFFNSVYDSLHIQTQQIYRTDDINQEAIDWNTIQDSAPVELMAPYDLDQKLQLSIVKHRGILKVSVQDKELMKAQIANFEFIQAEKLVMIKEKSDDEQQFDFKDLHGAYAGDPDCFKDQSAIKLDLRVKNVFAPHMVTKMLVTEDLNSKTNYLVKVITTAKRVEVTVQNLDTMEVKLQYELEHPQEMVTDVPQTTNITDLSQVMQHVYSGIRTFNSKHVAEEMIKIHKRWVVSRNASSTEHILTPKQKQLTLHRRVFYDENREDLLIITAEVIVQDQRYYLNSTMLPHDIEQVIFRIEQPEKKAHTVISHSIRDCLSDPSELNSLNRKDISRLKSLVKKLLDERTELKHDANSTFPYNLHFTTDQRSMSAVDFNEQ